MRSGHRRFFRKLLFVLNATERVNNAMLPAAIRRGLVNMIPLILAGSFALVFLSLPVPAYRSWMDRIFGSGWVQFFELVRSGTTGIFSLFLVVSVSYSYGTLQCRKDNNPVHPLIASFTSLGAFIVLSGMGNPGFTTDRFGIDGILTAILVSAAATILFGKLSSVRIFRIHSFAAGGELAAGSVIGAIIPAAVTIAVFAFAAHSIYDISGILSIQGFLSGRIRRLFLNIKHPAGAVTLYELLKELLWFAGIHGSNVLEPVAQARFVPAVMQNHLAVSSGTVPLHVFSKTFSDTFVSMGGSGSTLCLMLAIWIAGTEKNQRQVALLSLFPSLFNINELILFGIPIVLNPVFFIPFICVPLLLTFISAASVLAGLVPYTVNPVTWTTPVFLSGYSATGSVRGCLLQLFNICLGTLCYIPFVRLSGKVAVRKTKSDMNYLYAAFRITEKKGIPSMLLGRYDDCNAISRTLVINLNEALTKNEISLFYQPQVDYAGNIFGIEALLRWNFGENISVYPPLLIALAKKPDSEQTGIRYSRSACRDMQRWKIRESKASCARSI